MKEQPLVGQELKLEEEEKKPLKYKVTRETLPRKKEGHQRK